MSQASYGEVYSEIAAFYMENNLCVDCQQPKGEGATKRCCRKCADVRNAYTKEYNRKRRAQAKLVKEKQDNEHNRSTKGQAGE